MRRIRCAIYTRKSSEEGLEQDFNSLDAQREACAAYIASQKHEGWELLTERYDDGGVSGGNLERPALRDLMQAVDEKKVDQIVVYKIDRLTRSLADFAKLVDRLDQSQASFVSVTQSFNTSTSMGRLTLNVLLSFAQFEREVTAERIRDKIAASKRKGLWMGGNVPLGYQPDGRTLKIDDQEAGTIRTLFDLYLEHRAIRTVKEKSLELGLRTRQRERSRGIRTGGGPLDRGHIHHILANPIYAGRIRHKGQVYDGKHPAIIDPQTWKRVQELLITGSAKSRSIRQKSIRSPLAGKLYDETGDRFTPSHSCKNGNRFRYYVSRRLIIDRTDKHPDAWRLPAKQLEQVIADAIKQHLHRKDAAVRITTDMPASQIARVQECLPAITKSQEILALVEKVDIAPGSIQVTLVEQSLADAIGVPNKQIKRAELNIQTSFQMRRRGVELKLNLGTQSNEIDKILIKNIVRARTWLHMIKTGQSFDDIAKAESTSKRRVQSVIELALLSPYTLEMISIGKQHVGLTTDYLLKQGFSELWSEQHKQFAEH